MEVPTQNYIDNFNIPVESNPPPKYTKPTKIRERVAPKKEKKKKRQEKLADNLGGKRKKKTLTVPGTGINHATQKLPIANSEN